MKTVLDKVVVKELSEETTASGIVIKRDDRGDLVRGEVLHVGGEVKETTVGDIVHFQKQHSMKINDVLVVSEKAILGVE